MRRLIALLAVLWGIQALAGQEILVLDGPVGRLAGTISVPEKANGQVAIIIPGSGPTDRDGNNPLGVKAAPYKLFAEGLGDKGIATVRFDKRGLFGSKGAVTDANAVKISDYVADVRSWIASARRRTGAKCVWLIGHSEGGLVALATVKDTPDVCGLVLVSAAGRALGAVIREQLNANPANAPLLDQANAALASLESGQRADVSAMNPALLPLFRPQVQDFLIDEMSYDPAKLIAAAGKPVLILQGKRDIQISVKDAQLLKDADPKAELVLIDDANHVLKSVASDDRAANIATYGNPDLPLADGIVEAIAKFLERN